MFKKIIKYSTYLIITILILGALYVGVAAIYFYTGYRIISCNKNELIFKSPANLWAKVSCYDGKHVITPASNYQWSKSGKKVALNARGYLEVIIEENYINGFSVETITEEGRVLAKGAFEKAYLTHLAPYIVDNLNKELSKETGKNATYTKVYHLKVISSARFTYDVYFYIKDAKPEYIYACINYCHDYPPEVIKVESLK